MDMFKMIKEANSMRSKISKMEKELKNKTLEVESKGVKVKANAKGEILDIKIEESLLQESVSKVEKAVLSALQEAIKKSQKIMAEEAKKATGGMKIPGLM